MKRSDAFPSQYLSSADIAGREVRVIIEHIAQETVGMDDDQRQKPVMYFKNGTKGLVLNATNWDTLAGSYGEESDDWIGKPVTLHVERVLYKGKATQGIRMKIPPTSTVQAATKPAPASVPVRSENPADGLGDDAPF
jgi:hypothetical protein